MNKGLAITGLVLFGIVITFPIWYSLIAGGPGERPVVALPEGETECVEPKAYMTANHMDLLNQWRDALVRDGQKFYTSKATGKKWEMSLTRTCMKCHDKRDDFCLKCHTYSDVDPYCWDCHVEPGRK